MNDKNLLAVIIPYYKHSFFAETLKSIESQTDKRFTVYIGNDKSPDDPSLLIKQELKTVQYKYLSYKENLGSTDLTKQWMRIINEIQDEQWFMILGDDDLLGNNVVEEFYQKVESCNKEQITLMKFSRCGINQNGEIIREYTKLPNRFSSVLFTEKKFINQAKNSLSENIFKKSEFEKHGFKSFPLAWHSDDVAILECSAYKDFCFIDEAKISIRISELSISGAEDNLREKQYATYLFCEYLIKNHSHRFSRAFVHTILKRYREVIYRNRFPLRINLFSEYIRKMDIINAVKSFKMKHELIKRINNL